MATTHAVILAGARTPFGRFGGGLAPLGAVELGAHMIRHSIERAGINKDEVEHTILGCVVQAGLGQVPSRQANFAAGLRRETTSETINRVCGSAMRAIYLGDTLIRVGDQRVVLAGGMESMSNGPYLVRGARWGLKAGNTEFVDAVQFDGLIDPIHNMKMGDFNDNVSAEEHVSREEQDAWAFRSHQRAIAGRPALAEEIAPVEIVNKKKGNTIIEFDEGPRADTSLEALAKLKPAFTANGSTTAGNAPSLNDGAAGVVLASAEYAKAHGLKPLAEIVSYGQSAYDPPYLAYTPAMAAEQALQRAGLTIADIDLIEINEAFASVTLTSAKRLGIKDLDGKVNVNGGAIALGHPIGASGARLVLTLAYELRRRGGGIGLAAICSGTAQGDALIIKVDALAAAQQLGETMPVYPYKGKWPRIAPDVYLAPTACVIGDVTIGAGSSVWFNAVLRADNAPIVLGARCNVQDNCTIHTDDDLPAILGDGCSLGHAAVVHGARLANDVLVAMGAIVLSGATVGAESIIAANAVVTEGRQIAARSLVVGTPGKVAREVTEVETARIRLTSDHYVAEARNYAAEGKG